MLDPFGRKIDYLRISVTDRCDLRCVYCMPEDGVPFKAHGNILSYEQIADIARVAVSLGITRIRLTGGEPLVRKHVADLVRQLAAIEGVEDLSMTTNATRLETLAKPLKTAGLRRVNISLDSLDPEQFSQLTRGGDIQPVLRGIDAAVDAGLTPIKINMVIFANTTEAEINSMREFCESKGLTLQKIMQFSLYDRDDLSTRFHVERPPKCHDCNRLRLTADGFLKPCLFSEEEIPVRLDAIEQSILEAVAAKPANGSSCGNRSMREIGG